MPPSLQVIVFDGKPSVKAKAHTYASSLSYTFFGSAFLTSPPRFSSPESLLTGINKFLASLDVSLPVFLFHTTRHLTLFVLILIGHLPTRPRKSAAEDQQVR